LLRKDGLFYHRSECYGPPSPSISLESIKSQKEKAVEMAKALRQKEISMTIIAETSGLSIEEIKGL